MDNNNGENDLNKMLSNLDPLLSDDVYVFCFCGNFDRCKNSFTPWATICEDEGTTLILTKLQADQENLPYEDQWRRITLQIHSSLHSVGLTAAISRMLADGGISANMVAGYYHDHIFVPKEKADLAMKALTELTE